MDIAKRLEDEFHLQSNHVANIIGLIDEGCTIPFIARYRKEMTNNCDDQVLRDFDDRLKYLRNLDKRKEEVVSAITEQEKMTDEIAAALATAETLTEVEDIYRPYKQKKKTRATVAIAKGLQPLADIIIAQEIKEGTKEELALPYVNAESGVNDVKEALAGACDIVAEMISDSAELRKKLRSIMTRNGELTVKMTDKGGDDAKTYEMYKDFSELVSTIPSHRVLAINRGEKDGYLKADILVNKELMVKVCCSMFVKRGAVTSDLVASACEDAFVRLIGPSIEREVRAELTDAASEQAIKMYEVNLKPLLMQPPVKDKVTLGLDPGYRTGCKIAVVDATGKVLDTSVIFPTTDESGKIAKAKESVKALIEKYSVDIISIGNGTASKESEIFIADLIKEIDRPVSYMVVSEAGASVYSASKEAAKEFPDFDVTQRSAVSIARRLQDPLAELIKIDPKSMGVGQYQHDMPKARLDSVLGGVLESCVNSVGVDLNTASEKLLSYVSGLNSGIAKSIVAFREKYGKFSSREDLKEVPKLGPKAFEQCAGFLRIPRGKNILDNTAVHPESYEAAEKLLSKFGYTDKDVEEHNLKELSSQISSYGREQLATELGIGMQTLEDIAAELLKPGRDIRDQLPPPMLRTDVMDISDLHEGMEMKGTVRNVTDFGAFVDIGVHHDGLVHISEMSDGFIKHPSEKVKVGQVVTVRVLSVDTKKNRISLTMKTKTYRDKDVI